MLGNRLCICGKQTSAFLTNWYDFIASNLQQDVKDYKHLRQALELPHCPPLLARYGLVRLASHQQHGVLEHLVP